MCLLRKQPTSPAMSSRKKCAKETASSVHVLLLSARQPTASPGSPTLGLTASSQLSIRPRISQQSTLRGLTKQRHPLPRFLLCWGHRHTEAEVSQWGVGPDHPPGSPGAERHLSRGVKGSTWSGGVGFVLLLFSES